MVDEDPWARPPDDADETAVPPGSRRRRWVLPALLVTLAFVLLAGAWVVAAQRGAQAFSDGLDGERHTVCDGDLTADDVRPQVHAPAGLPTDLREVVTAFESFFEQDRWSYTETSEELPGGGEGSAIRLSVDGDVLERRNADGFVGMMKPGAGIGRFEGDRFWVPACVNGIQLVEWFQNADCVEREDDGAAVHVTWAARRDGTCEDAILRFGATLEDGALTSWTFGLEGRHRYTSTVRPPADLSWPSPLWIVPTVLSGAED